MEDSPETISPEIQDLKTTAATPNEDPFDKDDFNVAQYLNSVFPDGKVSLRELAGA
jgi:hypothetical protein